jgi:glutathione synthase/RimK-type ligase-like ATP-grasp enzyme
MAKLSGIVVYVLGADSTPNGLVKYKGSSKRQFRQAYYELIDRFQSQGMSVFFAQPTDISDDGKFTSIYTLQTEHPDDDNGLLFYEVKVDFRQPVLLINRVKDQLYNHPAYPILVASGLRILNQKEVAQYGDKTVSYEHLSKFMPNTLILREEEKDTTRRQNLSSFINKYGIVVVKPRRENGGKGIIFLEAPMQEEINQVSSDQQEYIVQEYIETNEGVEGIVKGRHDVRLYTLGGVIVAGSVRQPKGEGRLSNTSQGGSIRYIQLADLPPELMAYAQSVLDALQLPKLSFVSIDFFFGKGKWYLVEVNDQPGITALYQDAVIAPLVQDSLVNMCKEAFDARS